MLLLEEVEKQIRPMSNADKEQLMVDIWRMLTESAEPDASKGAEKFFTPGEPVGNYMPIITPNIAKQLETLL